MRWTDRFHILLDNVSRWWYDSPPMTAGYREPDLSALSPVDIPAETEGKVISLNRYRRRPYDWQNDVDLRDT